MGPPGPNDNSKMGTPSCVWGPLTIPLVIRAYVRVRLQGCTRTCTLKPRAIGCQRMVDYSASVIEGIYKKKIK